jgi:hypothetical protein
MSFPVDAAFGERDPLRRIAFVAAFAMSNYSSTIGRIAKPFNPMLVRPAFIVLPLSHTRLYRARRSNTFEWTKSTAMSPSK